MDHIGRGLNNAVVVMLHNFELRIKANENEPRL